MKNKAQLTNYPPQTGTYKITTRKNLGNDHWYNFQNIILPISMNNKKCDGEYFFCTLQWAKERFDTIDIIICDTLNRHNIMFEMDIEEQEAKQYAQDQGNKWIQNNNYCIDQLQSKIHLSRWNDWHYQTTFNNEYLQLEKLYTTNKKFAEEANSSFNEVWLRRQKQQNYDDHLKTEFIQKVIQPYLFEEMCITSILLQKIDSFIAYPGLFPQFSQHFITDKFNILDGFKNRTILALHHRKNKLV